MKKQQGFSLVELMIVVAIIGALTAFAIPAYQDYVQRSEAMAGLATLKSLQTTTQLIEQETGAFPATLADIGAAADMNGLGTLALDDDASTIEFAFGGDTSLDTHTMTITLGNTGFTCATSAAFPVEMDGCVTPAPPAPPAP